MSQARALMDPLLRQVGGHVSRCWTHMASLELEAGNADKSRHLYKRAVGVVRGTPHASSHLMDTTRAISRSLHHEHEPSLPNASPQIAYSPPHTKPHSTPHTPNNAPRHTASHHTPHSSHTTYTSPHPHTTQLGGVCGVWCAMVCVWHVVWYVIDGLV